LISNSAKPIAATSRATSPVVRRSPRHCAELHRKCQSRVRPSSRLHLRRRIAARPENPGRLPLEMPVGRTRIFAGSKLHFCFISAVAVSTSRCTHLAERAPKNRVIHLPARL